MERVAPSSPEASHRMRMNRRVDTGPELVFRSALHRRGLRFRKDLPIRLEKRSVRPDVVFPRKRVAIFIDGCFWHGCPEHGSLPKANGDYWTTKLDANKRRDAEVSDALRRLRWTVFRFWEHEDLAACAVQIETALETPIA